MDSVVDKCITTWMFNKFETKGVDNEARIIMIDQDIIDLKPLMI
jgi:hypothetical protein